MLNFLTFLSMTGVRLPSSKAIYSYFVDMDSGNFMTWDMLVPKTQSLIEKGLNLLDIFTCTNLLTMLT